MSTFAEDSKDEGDPTDFLSGVCTAHKKAASDHAALAESLNDAEKKKLLDFVRDMQILLRGRPVLLFLLFFFRVRVN